MDGKALVLFLWISTATNHVLCTPQTPWDHLTQVSAILFEEQLQQQQLACRILFVTVILFFYFIFLFQVVMACRHIGNLFILIPCGILRCYLSIPGFHVSHQKLYIGVLPFSSYSRWTSTNQWYFWATKSKAGMSKFMMILSERNYHQISISGTPDYMILFCISI